MSLVYLLIVNFIYNLRGYIIIYYRIILFFKFIILLWYFIKINEYNYIF